jgi:hypothetical protein
MNCRQLSYRIILLGILVFVSLTTLLSCKKKEEAPAPASVQSDLRKSKTKDAAPPSAPAPEQSESGPAAAPAATAQEDTKRKVIMSHALDLEVKSISAALESLTKLAEANGGYVYESTRTSYDRNSYAGTIGIRVPVGKTSGVLGAIRSLGRVDSERSNAEDITDDYVDMEARLKNAQASEGRLKEMYQRAGTVKEVLEVEKELTRVRGDIEAFMAKKRNWDILVEMVTIEVNLHEPSAAMPAAHNFWGPIRSAFGSSLEGFANSLRALIIFIGVIAPWLVIIVPAYYLCVRQIKRRRERKRKELSSEKVQ